MNKDDILYISLLIISIPIGFLFKYSIRTAKLRAHISAAVGFVMVVIVCAHDTYHSLALTAVNALFIFAINPR